MFGIEVTPLSTEVLLGAALIFLLRVIGISVSTVRMLTMMRGKKVVSAALGFIEVLVYIVAIGQVVNDLANIWNILGYCLGFSAGTVVGIWLDELAVGGFANVRIISRYQAPGVVEAIRAAGYGATLDWATGRSGSVGMVMATVRRKEVDEVCDLVDGIDGKAFITVEEARAVRRGYMHLAQREK